MAGRRIDFEPKYNSRKSRRRIAALALSATTALGIGACKPTQTLPEISPTPSPNPTSTIDTEGAFGPTPSTLDLLALNATLQAVQTENANLKLELTNEAATPFPTLTPTPTPTETPTATPSPSPSPSPTATEAYASIHEHPDFQGIRNGDLDETMVLDNSDVALRGPGDFDTWLRTMKDAEARFPEELAQQVPFWNIFQHEVPAELRDDPETPVLLGLWNPKVNRTNFDSTRLNFASTNPEALKAADERVRSLMTQVEYNGRTRWAFTAPLHQLDIEGLVVPSADGLTRAFSFANDYEATQLALVLQNAAFIEAAEDARNNSLSEGEEQVQLSDEQIFAAAHQAMHNTLIEQGWDDSGFMPALYIDEEGKVQETRYYLRDIPMSPVGRVQMMPAPTTNREDQQPGIVCGRFDKYDSLANYGSQIDAGSQHLVLNVVDLPKVAATLSSWSTSSSIVAALDANNRPVLAHLISEPENSGYQNIPENDSYAYSHGFELAPEFRTNPAAAEDPFGVTLYEDCEPAPIAPAQPIQVFPTNVPPGPEHTPPPGVTPPPEITPPPQETPRVTPLPTNDPITAPTRGPVEPDWNPTLVPTPHNTPVPATEVPQVIPPTPVPQEVEPTSVF